MKIELRLDFDSYNTYPQDSLIIDIREEHVFLKITDDDREISVVKEDLKKIISLL